MTNTMDGAGLRRIALLELSRNSPANHGEAMKMLHDKLGPYHMDEQTLKQDVAGYFTQVTKH